MHPGLPRRRRSPRCCSTTASLSDAESRAVRAVPDGQVRRAGPGLARTGRPRQAAARRSPTRRRCRCSCRASPSEQLPVNLTNINNVHYRPDGKLVALAYNGNVYLLSDSDGDGLEDQVELFWENKGRLRAPIGMALTPPGYPHGNGVFVAVQGQVLADRRHRRRRQGRQGDRRRRGLEGAPARRRCPRAWRWPTTAASTSASARPTSPTPTCSTREGKSHYDLKSERGTILRVAPDFQSRARSSPPASASRSPWPSTARGDLFATDQEGATWLPNGNPFDELLHIQQRAALRLPAAAPEAPARRDRRAVRLRLRARSTNRPAA